MLSYFCCLITPLRSDFLGWNIFSTGNNVANSKVFSCARTPVGNLSCGFQNMCVHMYRHFSSFPQPSFCLLSYLLGSGKIHIFLKSNFKLFFFNRHTNSKFTKVTTTTCNNLVLFSFFLHLHLEKNCHI